MLLHLPTGTAHVLHKHVQALKARLWVPLYIPLWICVCFEMLNAADPFGTPVPRCLRFTLGRREVDMRSNGITSCDKTRPTAGDGGFGQLSKIYAFLYESGPVEARHTLAYRMARWSRYGLPWTARHSCPRRGALRVFHPTGVLPCVPA